MIHAAAGRLLSLAAAGVLLVSGVASPATADAASPHPQALRGSLVAFAAGHASGVGATRSRTVGGHAEVAVSVELATAATPDVLNDLRSDGLAVRNVAGPSVEGYASASALRDLATDAAVQAIQPIVRPRASGVPSPAAALLGTAPWTAAGFTGGGVKVGIVDLGFSGLAARLGSQLPATVVARCYTDLGSTTSDLADCDDGEVHGTAVAETIASVAPGISLYVADPNTLLELSQTIDWMVANGVRVINSSVVWFLQGPGDGTSAYANSVYRAVDKAVAGGALWVNSAGNYGLDAWSGPWTDPDADGLLNWTGSEEQNPVSLQAGESITAELRWTSVASDYALILSLNGLAVAVSDDRQVLTKDPAEAIEYTATVAGTYTLSVRQVSGLPDPRLRLLIGTDRDSDLGYYVTEGSLPAPADSRNPGLVAVGAVGYGTPSVIEPYSSEGPTTDGRVKPDLVAPDCVPTTVYSQFCGTSQAAPFTVGAAAMALQGDPTLSPVQLAGWLRSRAAPLGAPVPNSVFGAGILNLGPSPANAPAAATFVDPPASGVAGQPFLGAPVVGIVDAAGALVTKGPGAFLLVTLTLTSNTTGAQLTCAPGGTTPAPPLPTMTYAGLADFSACQIDLPGTYTLRADVAGLPGSNSPLASATSVPFTVRPAGSVSPLSLTTAASIVQYPGAVTLSAAFALPDGANQPLELQTSANGSIWTDVAPAITDASGAASLSVTPAASAFYRLLYSGPAGSTAPATTAEVSPDIHVAVRPRLSLVSSLRSGSTIVRGTRVVLTTTYAPTGPTIARPRIRFNIYQKIGTAWHLSRTVYVNAGSDGRARLVMTMSAGSWWIRAQAQATATNTATAWLTGVRYLVR